MIDQDSRYPRAKARPECASYGFIGGLLPPAFALIGFLFGQGVAKANDVYIAQTAIGAANGSACANAYAYSYFNTSENWTANAPNGTLIGPGTTVHLCGRFVAPAGASGYLTFRGSGNNVSPITLIAEPETILEAPYWGPNGAIAITGQSYAVIDGNNAGVIQATANGTNLPYQAPNCGSALVCTAGIYASSASDVTIKGWTISNIYVNVPARDESIAGEGSYGIAHLFGSNISISRNVIHDSKWGIYYSFRGSSESSRINISNNTIYHVDHGISIGSGNTNAVLSGPNVIFGNTIYDGANWDDDLNNNHHDGIHLWAVHAGAFMRALDVYNNYIYGDWGQHLNDLVYMEGAVQSTNLFNNVILLGTPNNYCGFAAIGVAGQGMAAQAVAFYNNVVVGSTTSGAGCPAIHAQSVTQFAAKNNIVSNFRTVIADEGTGSIIDYNIYYNFPSGGSNNPFRCGPNWPSTFASWQITCRSDIHGAAIDPGLSSDFHLGPASSAIGTGANLTSLGVSALNLDKAGAARPTSGGWDPGAYRFTNSPNPPTALTTVVN